MALGDFTLEQLRRWLALELTRADASFVRSQIAARLALARWYDFLDWNALTDLVAAAHSHPGAPSRANQPSTPAISGAAPSATSVPTATPVRCTATKKSAWYPATPTAISHTSGRRNNRVNPRLRAKRTKATMPMAPISRRTAATLGGQACGASSALDVPEVLNSAAATSTPATGARFTRPNLPTRRSGVQRPSSRGGEFPRCLSNRLRLGTSHDAAAERHNRGFRATNTSQ